MAYTYAQPVAGAFPTPKDEVRYLLRDTSPAAPFSLSDEEIAYELAQAGGVPRAAASQVAFAMAVSYSSQATTSKSVGNLSLSKDYASTSTRYYNLGRQLANGGVGTSNGAAIVFTGTDEYNPQFILGQFDNKE